MELDTKTIHKISSCNTKNCPSAIDVGDGEKYIVKCKKENRIVDMADLYPFPEWCPLPARKRCN